MRTRAGIRMKTPAHPGGFVRSEIVDALGLSVTRAALALGVTRAALSALLNERVRLSPAMALHIEKAFGVSMDTLMRMQNSFNIAQARKRKGKGLAKQCRKFNVDLCGVVLRATGFASQSLPLTSRNRTTLA